MIFDIKNNKQFEKVLKKFIDKVENKNEIDEKLKQKILDFSDCSNKREVMDDLINKIDIFNDYDEDKKIVNFPYKPYIKKFLTKKER